MGTVPVGQQLRQWRERRRVSQMQLALDADISPRHLSFIETGRSRPSTGTLERLAEQLEVPYRARNGMLRAAGFAPRHAERPLDDPAMEQALVAIQHILKGHEPYPAIAVDRHWNILAANDAISFFTEQIGSALLAQPMNALKIALHPEGLAPQVVNLAEWHAHVMEQLDRSIEASADEGLVALRAEIAGYPHAQAEEPPAADPDRIWLPLIIDTVVGRMSFVSTITIFGTPVDVTLSELALEAFYPADEATADILRAAGRH
ncbi:helix-turn-helix domain-containing protein [Parasphingopyxis marina]|uniref:Helix-turn-helix transcriptional regulator n=1 Tax=Parasphingopyxis marina TaxID=2761622 RepID=A0A842HVX3_9SPHN|nr:helix-turn-helix transcriptional regulator [Parasphingopyxis marina]MBC2777256.1 helix-turn-helix transcriptional regulator [Parasphingopyxis marina]